MDNAVERFKKRRQKRMDAKNGAVDQINSVDAYKKRRSKRLASRMDAGNVGWVFGALQGEGIDTSGMDVGEAFEKWNEINKGNGGGNKKEESGNNAGKKNRENNKNEKPVKEYDGSGYHGEPGIVRSGKGGKMKPKSESAKRVNVADAIEETRLFKESGGKKGIAKNSLSDHIDADGNLSPERQKLHDEIIQNFFADKVPQEGKATMIMSGGGPASGKSFIEKSARKKFGDETTVTIDPDAFKAMISGYADMAKKDKKAAGFFHEESSALAKRAYQYAVDNNLNVVYDGTGDGSVNSVKKKLKAAQDAGYAVRGEYVTVDTDEAVRRNQQRYENMLEKYESGESKIPPRKVDDSEVRKIHAAVSDIVLEVAPLFDEFVLTDNNGEVGEEKPIIARCKRGGEIVPEKGYEDKLQRFFNKGKSNANVSNGKVNRNNNSNK